MKKAITQFEVDRERLSNDAGKIYFLCSTSALFLYHILYSKFNETFSIFFWIVFWNTCSFCPCFLILVFISIFVSVYSHSTSHFLIWLFKPISVDDQRVHFVSISEELKMKETQLEELKKQLVQWEGKLRQQQQLYEAVRSDRNHYSKGKIIWRDFLYLILD